MRTVQVNLEEPLVEDVDRAAKRLGISRSAFTRDALRSALDRLRTEALEDQHRAGYRRQPIDPDEIRDWEGEQSWPD
jgi:metal-responsive CopG/Arc/MetJ family transcriptional regulator